MGLINKIRIFLGRVLLGVDIKQRETQIKNLKKKVKSLEIEKNNLKEIIRELKQENEYLKDTVKDLLESNNLKFNLIVDFQINSRTPKGSTAEMSLHINGIAGVGYTAEEIISYYSTSWRISEMLLKAINTHFAPQQISDIRSKTGGDFTKTKDLPSVNLDCFLTIENRRSVPFKFSNSFSNNNLKVINEN